MIEHNTERLGKNLKCHRTDSMGHPVYILTFPTEWNEASFIADSILSDYKNNLSGCAVLIRSSILSRVFEEEFTSKNIPFKLIGATKFYDRAEIRDVIAYIRLLVYPNDNISFMRIISKPRRGFGISTLEKLHAKFDSYMAGLKSENLNTKQKKTATEFINVFDIDWQNMASVSVVQQLLENSGYLNMWRESKEPDAQERLEHIQDLVSNVIAKYDSLPEFLEYAALMTSEEDNNNFGTDAVSIMTMHASKGLEFDVVYLPAWEENIFPNEKSVREGGIEEERRLGYVSITRAKQVLVISNAVSRSLYGQRTYNLPSRFIDELDKRYLRCFGSEQHTTYTNKPAEPQKIIQKKKYLGKKVSHEELGMGTVVAEDGDVLTIAFNTRGIKKVMAGFVKII
ncbi:MAG: ATP-binding domain-containing protein [Alphaproteobacteria bacterium]|nr:ATP-binding domain-containing protein [Alphaproteobacteria bacterium]